MANKINKTTRIRITLDKVIYCSSMIATHIKDMKITTRLEQNIFVPLKGQKDLLRSGTRVAGTKVSRPFCQFSTYDVGHFTFIRDGRLVI